MIPFRLLCLFALLSAPALFAESAPPAPTTEAPALRDGEALTFRVGFAIFTHAGEIKIAAHNEINDGKNQLAVTTNTRTRGVAHGFYPFEAHGESVYDPVTGRIQIYTENSAGPKKKTSVSLEFDYATGTVGYTDFYNSARNRRFPFPPGNPMDLIASLVQTRFWNLKPGDTRDINVFFDDDIYELTIHALRYEDIRTRLGTFKTLVYEPRMEKTPPKGMFKRGSNVHVWISQDERRLPVKFEVEFKFGAGVATLTEYQPPGSAPAETK